MEKTELDKTAIKKFAIESRNKLREEVIVKAGLLGISSEGVKVPLDRSTSEIKYFSDSENASGFLSKEMALRNKLVSELERRSSDIGFAEAFEQLVEEVAYTWFNRLIAIRFMEVNNYLPDGIRVLSSVEIGMEPDIIREFADSSLRISTDEQTEFVKLRLAGDVQSMDKLYQILFIKQCNALNDILPHLFEKIEDYSELLFAATYTDKAGVIAHLVSDIPESSFNVLEGGQVEIIGWLYQYYNTEPKAKVFARPKTQKIRKEEIPAATQLFTPDWIVRYMVENSLGRFYIDQKLADPSEKRTEKEIADGFDWKYYLPSAEQPEEVQIQLLAERQENIVIALQELKLIDNAMGSGHVLVYAFDVFMSLYIAEGYNQREAAESIIKNNLFGLEIDKRAYQLAYFAIMMKARQYNRRILSKKNELNLKEFIELKKIPEEYWQRIQGQSHYDFNQAKEIILEIEEIIEPFKYSKEYGSIIKLENVTTEKLNIWKNFISVLDDEFTGMDILYAVSETHEKLSKTFDLISILIQKYEAAVTNPPYLNKMSKRLGDYIAKNHKDVKTDLFSVFIKHNSDMLAPAGYAGYMTPFVWMFIKSYEKLRGYLIKNKSINSLIQMEYSAFEEATVPICAFTIKNSLNENVGSFFKLSDFRGGMKVQNEKVLEAIKNPTVSYFYQTNQENFKKIPGMPISYWVSENLIQIYENNEQLYIYTISDGQNITANNNKYLRNIWEVTYNKIDTTNNRWKVYAKGGAFRKWYGNLEYFVDWSPEARKFYSQNSSARIIKETYWNRLGISWTLISSAQPSFRVLPEGATFDKGGSSIFLQDNNNFEVILGLLNSSVTKYLLDMMAPTLNYQVNDIRSIPFVKKLLDHSQLKDLVRENIELSKSDWDMQETSLDYLEDPLLEFGDGEISERIKKLEVNINKKYNAIKKNEEQINKIVSEMYNLTNDVKIAVSEKDISISIPNQKIEVMNLISYVIGCILGRYSFDKDRSIDTDYKLNIIKYPTPIRDNILIICEDNYFEDSQFDIVNLFNYFIEIIFGKPNLEKNIQFIADTLGGNGSKEEIIRSYFVKHFYKNHLKMFKKRPIYWEFSSGKENGFKALVYMHRINSETLSILRVEYLHKVQKSYENRIEQLQSQIRQSESSADKNIYNKELTKVKKQYEETKIYDAKLGHLANLRTSIDLDDGVIYNYNKIQTDEKGNNLNILSKRG
ncbi:BREX-1 system adenine-specific DNA-methyltransferase PglX [Enterococcus sp. CWB-B31]|uniref:BREX-1 system adenine-specific DNA-methyltransferase PglX n=1 Tax=Enterococcus sp. CWB-B31 TaxID=2885159 RepID=UPI001E3C49B7|nr:BREX-1 system adenine-specific DNA-methyltransferase PglX [Enterococcus sp. CWB-B31]MCB5955574.1 BREX-1 system adenine-specific DNA-methyltransferase PglX [Enterococcus sp. CWB-B31]